MVPTLIKRILPISVKHPLLAYAGWYWQLRGLPAQSWRDIAIFKEVMSTVEGQGLRVFEWGSGASTVYYPRFLTSLGRQFDWHAVDNSNEWRQRTREKIAKALLTERVQVHCSEFPAFWELPGYSYDHPKPPQVYANSARVKEYVDWPKNLDGRFDLMIVDGRFRRRCLQVAAEVVAPQGVVISHDAGRTHYHSSLDLYTHVQFIKTGRLPGTSQGSSVALASFDGGSLIAALAEKYGGL